MHSFFNAGRRAAALFAAMLVFCLLSARAEGMTVYTVTSLDNSGPGTLRQAIEDANASAGDFKIVIAVEGRLAITSQMPSLQIRDRSGWMQGNPNATLTDLFFDIQDGGILTLEDTIIDNSRLGSTTITVHGFNPDNELILKGHNRFIGGTVISTASFVFNFGTLTVDKAPGGTNSDCTLTLTGAFRGVSGSGSLLLKGGTLEAHATQDGIFFDGELRVSGGKLVAAGGETGICLKSDGLIVRITGGTTVASGGTWDISLPGSLTYTGGSLDARKFKTPWVRDERGNRLYLVTVTVGNPAVRNKEVSCLVDGFEPFTAMTDEDGKLYLWMREADQGVAEINDGGTVYRATGTVQANYDNAMTAWQVPPVVTGVVVTPASATAGRGGAVQFSAAVEGLYNPPQAVTWTVENGHAGTHIGVDGYLTISSGETSRTLLVTATSVADPSFSDTAEVAVTAFNWGGVILLLILLLILAIALFLLLA